VELAIVAGDEQEAVGVEARRDASIAAAFIDSYPFAVKPAAVLGDRAIAAVVGPAPTSD
jgi:hypothetical protein